jgi:shikimate kinase
MISLERPISIVGMMGSGKTTLGNALAKKWGVPFLDTDAMIEQEYHKTVADIFATEGEAFFREAEHNALKKAVHSGTCVIGLGGGAFIAARNRAFLKEHTTSIFLKVTEEILFWRLEKNRAHRPLLQGDIRERIATLLAEREPFYKEADITVSFNQRMSIRKAIALVEAALAAHPSTQAQHKIEI